MDTPETSQQEGKYKYYAFISYSHHDKKWAEWLHNKIEAYKIPKKLWSKLDDKIIIPKRLRPVFRDSEELSASFDLGGRIKDALRLSRYLIVICSPHAAKSIWVNKEIIFFKSLGRGHLVLPFIVDGEPNATDKHDIALKECFPKTLRFFVDKQGNVTSKRTEPIAPDIRQGKDGKNNAILKLLAGLLEVDFDSLKHREQERKIQILTVWGAILTILVAAFSFLTWLAWTQKQLAVRNEATAQNTLANIYTRDGIAYGNEHESSKSLLLFVKSLSLRDTVAARTNGSRALFGSWLEIAKIRGHGVPCISPSNQNLASLSPDNYICVWNLDDGELVTMVKRPTENIYPYSFSNGGQSIALVNNNNNSISILTLDKNFKSLKFDDLPILKKGHKESIHALSFSPDDMFIASGSADNTICIWNITEVMLSNVLEGHDAIVVALAFSPDGSSIASGSCDGTVRVWDLIDSTRNKVFKRQGQLECATCVAFSPDSFAIAAGYEDSIIRIWDLFDSSVVDLRGHQGKILSLAFSPDGKLIASGSKDNTIRIWDSQTGKELSILRGHSNSVYYVAFSRDGQSLFSSSNDHTIRIWNYIASETQTLNNKLRSYAAHYYALSEDGKKMALSEFNSINNVPVRVVDCVTGDVAFKLKSQTKLVRSVSFSPNGQIIASGSDDGTVCLWDNTKGELLAKLNHDSKVFSISFSPDGKTFASGCFDGFIYIWDVENKKLITKLNGHISTVKSIKFSLDGNNIVSYSWDQSIIIWEKTSVTDIFKIKNQIKNDDVHINSMSLTHDGKKIIIGNDDNTIRILDSITGRQVNALIGHTDSVNSVAISHDDRLIASTSCDNTIRIWDLLTGILIYTFKTDARPYGVEFNDESNALFSFYGGHGVARFNIGLEKSFINKISFATSIGIPYELDINNQLIDKSPLSLAQSRLHAAREGTIWWRNDGGKSLINLYSNIVEQENNNTSWPSILINRQKLHTP